MIDTNHLLEVAAAYAKASNIEEKTVSARVFQDSKRLTAIRGGADITVGRFNSAMEWFAGHWPEGAVWPQHVQRPGVDRASHPARPPPRRTQVVEEGADSPDDPLPAALDRIASQMAAEFGFTPSHLQVVQFMAKKTGFSVG